MDIPVNEIRSRANWLLAIVTIICFGLSAFFWIIGFHWCIRSFFGLFTPILAPGDFWCVPLFFLPLPAQVGLYILYRRVRKESHRDESAVDKSTIRFYAFCLCIMSISTLGYGLLWAIYPIVPGVFFISCSILALSFIGFLLLMVGWMTYVIMWTQSDSTLLRADDILDDVKTICLKIKKGHDEKSSSHLVRLYKIGEVKKIVDDFINENRVSEDKARGRFIKTFNKHVLNDKEFYEVHIDVEEREFSKDKELKEFLNVKWDETTPRWRRRYIRRILDFHFPTHINQTVRRRAWYWENINNDLKEGVSKTPFWALVFFFTVFLGITYLFSFTFSFYDRWTFQTTGNHALFMARNHPSNLAEPPAGAAANSHNPTWPEYAFYLDGADTAPVLNEAKAFNEDAYQQLKEQGKALLTEKSNLEQEGQHLQEQKVYFRGKLTTKLQADFRKHSEAVKTNQNKSLANDKELMKQYENWKHDKNKEHLDRLLAAIEAETNYGEGILVEVNDGGGASGAAQPASASNSSVLEKRLQTLRSLIVKRFPNVPLNMSWMESPALPTPGQGPPGDDGRTLRALLDDTRISDLQKVIEGKMKESKVSEIDAKQFNDSLRDLRDLLPKPSDPTNARAVSPAKEGELRAGLSRLLNLVPPRGGANVEDRNYDRKLSQMLEQFWETSEAARLGFPGEGGDWMTVSVRPAQTRYNAIPLGLMDYVYFTICTITTTGYGDIVPTTTYAKLLCSLTNIIEVFFLVVFFNALLSVRGDRNRIGEEKMT